MRFSVALWKGQQAARRVLAATQAASDADHKSALDHLQAAFDLGLPKHVEYTTLRAFLLSATGDDETALKAFKAAYACVDDTPDYSHHDRTYLKAYIADGANRAAGRLSDALNLPQPPDMSKMKVRKVSSLIRAMFPLPDVLT